MSRRIIKIELVPTLVWKARYKQLLAGIKDCIYEPLKREVARADEIARDKAPIFNAAEYTSDFWQWYFRMHGTPTPGALKAALVFNEMTDCFHDETLGWVLGYGNIQRLKENTPADRWGLGSNMMIVGGKGSGSPSIISAHDVTTGGGGNFGYVTDAPGSFIGETFTKYTIADQGYWLGMEYGMFASNHRIPGHGFMIAGYAHINAEWINLIKSHAALKMLAQYWNST